MIPQLKLKETLKPDYALFLEQLSQTPFSGEIRADFGSRLINSTDNSIYQILPQGVVFPKTQGDIVHLFDLANQNPFKEIKFSPRGGGTGTNGQSLSSGIMIDFSKYMNQILELNLEQGWIRVQPGVILDQLNSYLKPYGVFFAPSLAPSNRATLGGMINTDACGKGSRIYGRTSNHILSLTWVLADGTVGESEAISLEQLNQLKQRSDSIGKIYRQVADIVINKQELIIQQFPQMPRFMTGYNLAKVYSQEQNNFNLNWILAGSEGTLAIITEAKLKLTPIPRYKRLIVLQYACFDHALAAAQTLLDSDPAAIETIDDKILELAKQDDIYQQVKDKIGTAKAINLVEFSGDDLDILDNKVNNIVSKIKLDKQVVGYYLAENEQAIAQLWELRKKGVGFLGNKPGNRKPIPFIEDTAVPPVHLNSYVKELKALLTQYQLDYAMFGHVDVGCLHVRPALDMKLPEDENLIRELSDQVVTLVKKYKGVMWGEHGKGFRSEYVPLFFGEELYQDLRKIKAAFDPNNQLNPGKIVTPINNNDEVVRLEAPLRGHFDRQVSPPIHAQYEEVFNCNGNGICFNFNPHEVICPSAKGTGDRIHSPKGRASLLREWLRQITLKESQFNDLEQGGNFAVKLGNTIGKWWGVYDYSHEVYEGMSGCLSCKACVNQCPVHVDIPHVKGKFLELYYTRYLRPWRDYFIGNIETLASWQVFAPKLVNFITQNSITQGIIKHSLGLVNPPQVSELTVKQGLSMRKAPLFNLTELSSLTESEKSNSIILLQDAFTSFYESQLVLDVYDLLAKLGYNVYVAPFFPSGKPLQVKGFLKEFKTVAKRNMEYLNKLGGLGIPIIGIEPSMVLTYRDEYSKIGYPLDCGVKVQLLQEFLVTQLHRLPKILTEKPYYLLSHCTEKTTVLTSNQQWQEIFKTMGINLIIVSSGCCGMAGIYGHEAEHYESSREIYQLSWGQLLPTTEAERKRVLVTGYSCRSQIKRFNNWIPLHPLQAMLSLITL